MTYSKLEELCLKSVSRALVPVLVQQLLSSGQLAKTQTEHGYEVVKISCTKDKRLAVSEVDIGIVRWCRPQQLVFISCNFILSLSSSRLKETLSALSKQVVTLEESIRRYVFVHNLLLHHDFLHYLLLPQPEAKCQGKVQGPGQSRGEWWVWSGRKKRWLRQISSHLSL